jgi:outer membrane immunogenic protein
MKYILSSCLLAISLAGFSQIPKGTSTISGSISATRTKSDSPSSEMKNSEISVQPSYGYFIIDNLLVGAALKFSNSRSTYVVANDHDFDYDSKSKTTTMGVGPFVRYYIPINEKFYAFGGIGYSRNWSDGESRRINVPSSTSTTSYVYYNLGLSAGVSYFITPNIALDLSIQHNTDRDTDRDNDVYAKSSTISLATGFAIFLRKD